MTPTTPTSPEDRYLARLDDIYGPPPVDPEEAPEPRRNCAVCGGPPPTSPEDSSHDECENYAAAMTEGPCCSICDGLGHGYPGGPPCPLEVTDYSGEPWWAI